MINKLRDAELKIQRKAIANLVHKLLSSNKSCDWCVEQYRDRMEIESFPYRSVIWWGGYWRQKVGGAAAVGHPTSAA